VAVVLGSGGIKAAASIGLWKVLERERIEVDMLVGCSGGALYATWFARGLPPEGAQELSTRLFNPRLIAQWDYRSLLRSMLPRLFRFDETVGLISDRRLMRSLRLIFGEEGTFAECRSRLLLAATDLESGESVVLSQGRILDAVRASISLPLLWPPWRVAGRLLYDGAASNPLPIDVAIREGAEVIVAMGFEDRKLPEIRSLVDLARQTSSIVQSKLLQSSFAFHTVAHHSEVIPVMPTFDRYLGLRSGKSVPYLIERGEEAAEAQVPYLRRLLAARPVALTTLNPPERSTG
jgi:NTE family protein